MAHSVENDTHRLKKGQLVLYEGRQSEVISVEPIVVIRIQDRIICGSLQERVKPVEESYNHFRATKTW